VKQDRYLLDTQTLLFYRLESSRLSERAIEVFHDTDSVFFLSHVSAWEMAIKCSLGKLKIEPSLDSFLESITAQGYDWLSINLDHILRVSKLPFHHRDPFDRLLVAQSEIEKLPIISNDKTLDAYGIERVW